MVIEFIDETWRNTSCDVGGTFGVEISKIKVMGRVRVRVVYLENFTKLGNCTNIVIT